MKSIGTPEKYSAQPWDVRVRLRMLRDEAKALYGGSRLKKEKEKEKQYTGIM